MTWFRPKNWLDETYAASLVVKGLDGLLEVAGGILLALVRPQTINQVTLALTQHELSQDPHDFIATRLLHSGERLASGGHLFAVIYLLVHGAIKLVIVVSLLQNRRWAYPFAKAALGLFIIYQLYKLAVMPTVGMAILTAFDGLVLWLVWREAEKMAVKR